MPSGIRSARVLKLFHLISLYVKASKEFLDFLGFNPKFWIILKELRGTLPL